MIRLKDYEVVQSGVVVIRKELERLVLEGVEKCAGVLDRDMAVDGQKTLWIRAQIALLRSLLDGIRVQVDDGDIDDGSELIDREG